jgi:CTD small phosphatase-like protein 2
VYANAILDKLECSSLISHRLFRDMCTKVTLNDPWRQVYLKDLRCIEGYDPAQVIIVDNSMLSFALQPENGIPISSYFFNMQDLEL